MTPAARSKRKRCPECGELVQTYAATGRLWRHINPATGDKCAGSNAGAITAADPSPDASTVEPSTDAQEAPTMPTTHPAKADTAVCPRCGRTVALRKTGEIRRHKTSTDTGGPNCSASGQTVDEARAAMPDPTIGADTQPLNTTEQALAAEPDDTAATALPDGLPQLAVVDPIDDPRGRLFHLDPTTIAPSPDNPRQDPGDLAELADSIRSHGVLEPILATRGADGTVTVAAGSRRHAAAILAAAGPVAVLVRDDVDDAARAELALIENLHRKDLTPLEEAGAFRRLIDDYGYTQGRLAKRLARSQGHISKRLALLKLPDAIRAQVGSTIHVADAVELARLPKSKAADVVDQAIDRLRPADRKDAATVADAVAAATRSALAEHDREAKVKAKRDELKAAGVTVLKQPQYDKLLYGTGWARLADGRPDRIGGGTVVALSDDEHRGYPCHGAVVWADASVWPVCSDPAQHAPEPEAAEASTTPATDTAAETAAAAERAARLEAEPAERNAHAARLDDAHAARVALIARLLKDRLPRDAVVDLVAGHLIGLYEPEAYADNTLLDTLLDDVARLLDGDDSSLIVDDERPWALAAGDLVYNFGPLTVALAFALVDAEHDLQTVYRGYSEPALDLDSGHVARYLRFLVDVGGYTLTDDDAGLLDGYQAQLDAVTANHGPAATPDGNPPPADVAPPAAPDADWEQATPPPPADKVKPVKA